MTTETFKKVVSAVENTKDFFSLREEFIKANILENKVNFIEFAGGLWSIRDDKEKLIGVSNKASVTMDEGDIAIGNYVIGYY